MAWACWDESQAGGSAAWQSAQAVEPTKQGGAALLSAPILLGASADSRGADTALAMAISPAVRTPAASADAQTPNNRRNDTWWTPLDSPCRGGLWPRTALV